MAQKQTAPMPEYLDLDAAWTIQWAAVSPTDGSAVSGVNVSNAAIIADQIQGTPDELSLTPLWLPIPTSELNLPDSTEAASEDTGATS